MGRYTLSKRGYPLSGTAADPNHYFKPGQPAGPGAPKGLLPLRTQFCRALKQFSKFKVPESYCTELREAFHFDEDWPGKEKLTVAQYQALKLHLLAMRGVEWAFDKIYGKNLVPDIEAIQEGIEVESSDTTLRMVRITHKETDNASDH